MKNTAKVMTLAAVMVIGTAAFAGPRHHHHKRDGLDLAYGIVNLVLKVVNPAPAVVQAPPVVIHHPAPRPVVIHKPAPRPAPRHRQVPPRRQAPKRR